MSVQVLIEPPPNYERLCMAFPIVDKPILFAWGDRIYNPQNAPISKPLKAHECLHGTRQGTSTASIEAWWERYIKDEEFRYTEELIGHRAEYGAFRAATKDRNAIAAYLHQLAMRLASPMYGSLSSYQRVREAIAGDRP